MSIDSIFKGDAGDISRIFSSLPRNTIDKEGGVDALVCELVCFFSFVPPKCGRSVENEDREAVDVGPKRCFCAWILAPVGNFCEAVELGTRCLASADKLRV